MQKIGLIFRREFLTRVRKKSFLLVTLLLPLLVIGIYAAVFYFMLYDSSKMTIAVLDEKSYLQDSLPSKGNMNFVFIKNMSREQLVTATQQKEYTGFLQVKDSLQLPNAIELLAGEKLGFRTKEEIEEVVNDRVQQLRWNALSVAEQQVIKKQKQHVKILFSDAEGMEASQIKDGLSYGVGMVSGYLLFLILLIYGSLLMRSVTEEKVNRVAEVLIGSVTPFQLMMGKIIGIGAVGLLQFIIWILFLLLAKLVALPFIMNDATAMINVEAESIDKMTVLLSEISAINLPLIALVFIVYFIGGYLLYAAFFAIVGSAADESQEDAQKLTFPITIPLIIGFVLLTKAIEMPNSSLAVFGSIFPLTSPVVMIGRVAQGIPDGVTWWELSISIVLLIVSFLLAIALAGRLYRTTILMYGKKLSWKELIKWMTKK